MKRVYPFSLIDGGGFRAVQMMLQEVDVFFVSDRSRKSSCETSKKGHTLPKTNMDPQKMMGFQYESPFPGGLFSGTMLLFRCCTFIYQKLVKLATQKFIDARPSSVAHCRGVDQVGMKSAIETFQYATGLLVESLSQWLTCKFLGDSIFSRPLWLSKLCLAGM